MQPHVVAATYNRFDSDMDGGPRAQAKNQTTRSGVSCFVQPRKAETLIETNEETGTRRITQLVLADVYFVDDAALNSDDLLTWNDSGGRSHVYRVVGYYPPCGTSVVWHAVCEEQI
jgi:hypothetical protein